MPIAKPLHQRTPATKSSPSCTIRIWMAGDHDEARRALRDYAARKGACISLQKTDYIYTGGEERGICATLINYPRFPKSPEDMVLMARDVAEHLCRALCQGSYTIETPENCLFVSYRSEDGAD